jgi:hypothetical protein
MPSVDSIDKVGRIRQRGTKDNVLTANFDAHWTFISKAQLVEGWFAWKPFV